MLLQETLFIVNRSGLHARAATKFVQTAHKFQSDIWVAKDGQEVNGKSIMGLLLLVANQGSTVTIRCDGADAKECLVALRQLIEQGFGES